MKKIFFIFLIYVVLITPSSYIYAANTLTVDKQLLNQQITIGYTPGYNQVLTECLVEQLQDELHLNVKGIEYSDSSYLKEAVNNGDVDIASGLIEETIESNLYYSKSIFREYKIVVTTLEQQISKVDEISNMKVGFLSIDENYAMSLEMKEENNLEFIFFDTFEEVEQALLNNEIGAFICSDYLKDFVINNPSLISRITLNDVPSAYRFATAKEDMYPIIDNASNIINETLYERIYQYEDDIVSSYLNTNYPLINSLPQQIAVNLLSDSFPYSYVNEDGKYVGSYIDMLDFFSEKTGIDYSIVGSEPRKYSEILVLLNNNTLQIAIGYQSLLDKENVIELSALYTNDYLITIQSKKESDMSVIDDIRIGIPEELEDFTKKNGFHNVKVYNTTLQSIIGLKNNEIDTLVTYKSVLDYYQQVQGESSLNQNNFILMEHPKSILANKNNEEFNQLFQDLLRIYYILGVGDEDSDSDIISTNYFNSYLELEERQSKYAIYSIIITILLLILFARIALQRSKENRMLEYKYTIDELTGILNRNSYKEKINKLILANQNKLGVYIFIDLNYFKRVNDTYGHNNGDIVLIEFAKGLSFFENNKTISFRIAGDEFGIYACGFDTLEELEFFVEGVATYPFGEIELSEGSKVTMKYSLGYAIYPIHSTNVEKLHEYADFAMYKAKENKDRNEFNCQVCGFDKQIYDTKYKSTVKMNEVEKVIRNNEIQVVFQPILNIENGSLVGYEGVVNTTNDTFIDWYDFKKNARKVNMHHQLDELIFENIIKHFNLSTNLYINMEDRDMVTINHQMNSVLKKFNKEYLADKIVLEVSDKNEPEEFGFTSIHRLLNEHILDSTDYTKNKPSKLKKLLTMYPKVIKISRSLFEEIDDDFGELEFLKMLVEFSNEHGFELLCDGVESEEELVLMKSLGIKYAKGLYLCEPNMMD